MDYSGTFYDSVGGGVTITGGAVDVYDIVVFSGEGDEYRFTGHMTESGLSAVSADSTATMLLKHYEDDIGLYVETSTGFRGQLTP
jgi:hypothetical protein